MIVSGFRAVPDHCLQSYLLILPHLLVETHQSVIATRTPMTQHPLQMEALYLGPAMVIVPGERPPASNEGQQGMTISCRYFQCPGTTLTLSSLRRASERVEGSGLQPTLLLLQT